MSKLDDISIIIQNPLGNTLEQLLKAVRSYIEKKGSNVAYDIEQHNRIIDDLMKILVRDDNNISFHTVKDNSSKEVYTYKTNITYKGQEYNFKEFVSKIWQDITDDYLESNFESLV